MNNTRTFVGTVAAIAVIAIVVGVFIWWQSGNVGETAQTTALEQETPVSETMEEDALDERLIEAVTAGDPTEVERLLEAGADPDTMDYRIVCRFCGFMAITGNVDQMEDIE